VLQLPCRAAAARLPGGPAACWLGNRAAGLGRHHIGGARVRQTHCRTKLAVVAGADFPSRHQGVACFATGHARRPRLHSSDPEIQLLDSCAFATTDPTCFLGVVAAQHTLPSTQRPMIWCVPDHLGTRDSRWPAIALSVAATDSVEHGAAQRQPAWGRGNGDPTQCGGIVAMGWVSVAAAPSWHLGAVRELLLGAPSALLRSCGVGMGAVRGREYSQVQAAWLSHQGAFHQLRSRLQPAQPTAQPHDVEQRPPPAHFARPDGGHAQEQSARVVGTHAATRKQQCHHQVPASQIPGHEVDEGLATQAS
jgi:hypothetical protein